MAHFCERKFFAAKPCFLAAVVVILYGNISGIVQILYALVAQPVEHLTFNQRARDSSSLERTKENLRLTVKRYELVVGFLLFVGTKWSGKCDKNATNHEEMVMKECSLHN